VALTRWDAVPGRELLVLLAQARDLVYAKLPRRTKDALAMPSTARKKLIAERRKLLASRKRTTLQ
jgi:hypothetical protein